MPLSRLVHVISNSETSYLPVVDNANQLLGEIDIMKIRNIMFRTELYQRFTVNQIMTPVPTILYGNEPMTDVMKKFEQTGANFLPVININNQLQGYISRTRLYSMYRKLVADFSAE